MGGGPEARALTYADRSFPRAATNKRPRGEERSFWISRGKYFCVPPQPLCRPRGIIVILIIMFVMV